MPQKIKIVSVSSEVAPFSKTGGLGDVARSLPKALARLGHEVVVITPLYGKIIDKKEHDLKLVYKNINVRVNSSFSTKVNYWKGYLMKNLPVYFIENTKYFSQRKSLYGSSHENSRFLLFDVAALKFLSVMKFKANIIHCHDWQTGLIPHLLKTDFRHSETLKKSKTIFTIHNLIFQFGRNWWTIPVSKKDYGRKSLPHFDDPKVEYINFAKRAILNADVINTVSEQYREEIMTKKFGQDLHRILRNREDKLFGIVNGIDYNAFNPKKDPGLFKNYDYKKIHRKKINKEYIQKKFKLPIDIKMPVICTTSRVTFQKGFELISKTAEHLMKLNLQLIIIGSGDKKYIQQLQKQAKKFPKKLIVIPSHKKNQRYETLMYAGSDMLLLPSHYEPCGINQLIAMRYGCIPIVRRVGGLNDTVTDFNPATGEGNGFVFKHFDCFQLYGAIIRAMEAYKNKIIWRNLMVKAMQQSNSWEIPAQNYVKLYKKAMRFD